MPLVTFDVDASRGVKDKHGLAAGKAQSRQGGGIAHLLLLCETVKAPEANDPVLQVRRHHSRPYVVRNLEVGPICVSATLAPLDTFAPVLGVQTVPP